MVTTTSRYLACVGTTQAGRTLTVAHDPDTGALLGVVCGPAIVPTLPPEGWTPAPFSAWQMVYCHGTRRLYSFPFHSRDAASAPATWEAIRKG